MQTPLLTKPELDRVLAPTSPHSFKHNIALLCAANEISTSSEPVTKLSDVQSMVDRFTQIIDLAAAARQDLRSMQDGVLPESALLGFAMCLSGIAIEARTSAAVLGIPLEEVQEAMIGTLLVHHASQDTHDQENVGELGAAAVNTVIYGVRKARHPYENIQDE